MKTSLEIDDRLYQEARMRAARDGTTVRALVEEGLAAVLGLGPPIAPRDAERERRELAELEALAAQVRVLPLLTTASDDELLDYDDDGGFA